MRRRFGRFAAITAVVLSAPLTANAFEISSPSLGGFFDTSSETAVSSFDNSYSYSQSFSTATEFKSVKCKRAVADENGNLHIKASGIELDEVTLQQASDLVRKIDDIQYRLCMEMIKTGRTRSLVVTIGEERNEILRFGRQAEVNLQLANSPTRYKDEIEKYTQQLSER